MKNPLFNMRSVIKGSFKANVGAGASSGAETSVKLEPERKQKVSAPQHMHINYSKFDFSVWVRTKNP
jgi:hypothetical protein